MASIFTKIIKGEIPCYKIAESEQFFAFLDINPTAEGHTLCVPKHEVDYIYDLDDDTLAGLHLFSKRVAQALESCLTCKRVGVLVIGTEVPHAHVHLIPFRRESQMSIASPKLKLSSDRMQEIAAAVAEKYKEMNG